MGRLERQSNCTERELTEIASQSRDWYLSVPVGQSLGSAEPSKSKEGAVEARADSFGDQNLVAYAVPANGPPGMEVLRDALKAKLPDFMIPAAFLTLPALPLLPNGKVNRCAHPLPDPDRPSLRIQRPYPEPLTPAEKKLAAIWSGVLRMERANAPIIGIIKSCYS
jgi:hypothetical protein